MQSFQFQNRTEAGRVVGGILSQYTNNPEVLVLGLPRGGVPVAFEVALALSAPFDLFLVRKLGVPHQPELAMGAIASGGGRYLDLDIVAGFGISTEEIERVTNREREELDRRQQAYRGDRPDVDVSGRIVILVDDGLATGSSLRAAVQALNEQRPKKIVVAVPVASAEGNAALRREVDEVVAAFIPTPFFAVSRWYQDFSPTMDREIRELMTTRSILGNAVTKESSDGHAYHRADRPARGL